MLMGFCILIPFAFLTTYATQELHIPYSGAASLLAVIAVAGICGKLLLARLSDTLGRVKMMMLCGAFTGVGGLGMALVSGHFGLALFAAVFGIGYGAIWPLYAAASRDFFPQERAGSVVGLWTVYLGIGSIVSPILAGWTIDRSGGYFQAFMLIAISGVTAMLLLIPIINHRREGKP
jgi:MFS family permease